MIFLKRRKEKERFNVVQAPFCTQVSLIPTPTAAPLGGLQLLPKDAGEVVLDVVVVPVVLPHLGVVLVSVCTVGGVRRVPHGGGELLELVVLLDGLGGRKGG